MAMLVDLSISANTYNVSGPKAAGLEYCRTTRLHWLQTDLTQLANGSFVSESAAIADYGLHIESFDRDLTLTFQ